MESRTRVRGSLVSLSDQEETLSKLLLPPLTDHRARPRAPKYLAPSFILASSLRHSFP